MGWVVNATPQPFYLRKRDPVAIVQEAGFAPRAGVDVCGKFRPPPEFDPRTVQPVASRYTDCAIRKPCKTNYCSVRSYSIVFGFVCM